MLLGLAWPLPHPGLVNVKPLNNQMPEGTEGSAIKNI